MKKVGLITALALIFALVGCQGSKSDQQGTTQSQGSANQETTSAASGSTTDSAAAEKPTLASIPEKFKHAGYEYFGVGIDTPLSYKQSAQGSSEDAGQTTTLDRIENGKAYFKITRTGQFSQIGDSEIMVDETGVYTTSISGKTLDAPSLEVPADLAVGKSWKSDSKFDLNSNGVPVEVSQSMMYKADKIESVTTKAGKFETLRISASGTMTVSGTESKSTAVMWFCKGLGFVKMDTELTTAGKKQKISVELIKK